MRSYDFDNAKLRRHIEANGLKQTWIADSIGVTRGHLYMLTSGKSGPSISTYFKICKLLKVKHDYFLK